MRIVLVTTFYPSHGGGIEKVAAQLAQRLAANGHELVWCASDTDKPPSLPGVSSLPMHTFNAIERFSGFPYPLWSPASLARLSEQVRGCDAVHVHDAIYASSLAAALLARRHGRRLVATQHIGTVPLPRPLRPLLALANRTVARLVLKPAVGVAFISPVVRQYFESLMGPCTHFRDLPNGVDSELFSPGTTSVAENRAAMGFDPNRPLMLFVGRFVPKKRLNLVREMAQARPDWQWCVIGHGPERPDSWGLTNVRVVPQMAQSELPAYYRAADLLVLPSEGEGFPLVVQEAMSCGLPACITAEVAAGSTMPAALWLELPESPGETAYLGVAAIDSWLAAPEALRTGQRDACATYAASAWRWETAAEAHLRWLAGAAP